MTTQTKKYALLRTPEGPRYGHIVSLHRSSEAADAALDREYRRTLRRYPNAQVHLMFQVAPLPTPAGGAGKVGDRIAIDLSRR